MKKNLLKTTTWNYILLGSEIITAFIIPCFPSSSEETLFKVGYTLNSRTKKLSQSITLDLQNVTNNKNVFSQSYDDRTKSISTTYQLGFFPNFIYKIQF